MLFLNSIFGSLLVLLTLTTVITATPTELQARDMKTPIIDVHCDKANPWKKLGNSQPIPKDKILDSLEEWRKRPDNMKYCRIRPDTSYRLICDPKSKGAVWIHNLEELQTTYTCTDYEDAVRALGYKAVSVFPPWFSIKPPCKDSFTDLWTEVKNDEYGRSFGIIYGTVEKC